MLFLSDLDEGGEVAFFRKEVAWNAVSRQHSPRIIHARGQLAMHRTDMRGKTVGWWDTCT